MSTYQATPGYSSQPPGCDLTGIDNLGCKVAGVAAEADYLKGHQAKLAERRTQFDTARTAYQKAFTDVTAQRTTIQEKLAKLKEQLCQVCAEDRTCLDEAWASVKAELEKCGTSGGCCVAEADRTIDSKVEGGDTPAPEAVRAVITRLEAQAERVERCFSTLFAEPGELTKRATALATAVGKIQPNTDPVQAYAETLWAEHQLSTLDGGFATPAAFEDCLCIALKVSLELRQTLARLTGLAAERTCQHDKERTRCDWLLANVISEIIARCRRQRPAPAAS